MAKDVDVRFSFPGDSPFFKCPHCGKRIYIRPNEWDKHKLHTVMVLCDKCRKGYVAVTFIPTMNR